MKTQAYLTLVAALFQLETGFAKTYTVRSGDTLSAIAAREIGRPVYGPRGSLKRLLDQNKQLKDQNRIYPKQTLQVSPSETPAAAAAAAPSPASAPTLAPAAEPLRSEAPGTDESARAATDTPAEGSRTHVFGLRVAGILGKDHIEVRSRDRSYKTNLDSHLNKGLDLALFYQPTAGARIGLDLAATSSSYSDSRDQLFHGSSHVLKRLALFGDMTLAKSWRLGLELGTEQAYFFTARTPVGFELKPIFVDSARASVGYDFVTAETFRIGLAWSMAYHGEADLDGTRVERGSSYRVSLPIAWKLGENTALDVNAFYQRRNQGTEATSQKTSTSALEIGVRWAF